MKERKALRELKDLTHGLLVFVGSGKEGKSCSSHSLCEILYPDCLKCIYDPERQLKECPFPGYILVHELDEIPNGAIVFMEDFSRLFGSRGSGNNKEAQEWLGTISHKDIIVVITVQNTAGMDMEFFRSQNAILCLKKMHEEDVNFERVEHMEVQRAANRILEQCAIANPTLDRRAFIYIPRYHEVIVVPVPPWWGYQHSHMLREVKVCRPKQKCSA